MFFVSWGSAQKASHLGSAGYRNCSRCGQDSEFEAFVSYTVRHIYWLFRWTTGRETLMSCGNCGSTYPADDLDASNATKAIPFLDRRGWTIGAGAIASLFGLGAIASAQNSSQDAAFIASPHKGDLYELDMARMTDTPEAPVMYSVMRVTDVSDQTVTVQLARGYYDRLIGVQDDVRNGKARRADYYAPELGEMPRAMLLKMYQDGVINDVVR